MNVAKPREHTDVSVALTGSGGAGVVTAGQLLLDGAAKSGWYGLMRRSSGPQIRGGESAALLRLATNPVECGGDRFGVMLAFDWGNVDRFADEIPLDADSIVLFDSAAGEVPPLVRDSGARLYGVPFLEHAKAITGGRANMVALGVIAALLGIPLQALELVVGERLADKGADSVAAARLCLAAGVDAAGLVDAGLRLAAPDSAPQDRWNMTGNEACGLGALRGGVRFVAAYPITPASEMLEWLAPQLEKLGGVLLQAEDELASINMVIGASFGGVPALTATSGPGLSLMVEGLGLAVASEVPVVVINVMRGGPSTGIPTKSEQSDLNVALYGLHGDAPHLVLAPLSIADGVFTSQWAVHLAEALQAPAIVLSDQALGQSRAIVDPPRDLAFVGRREVARQPAETYRRYALTANGVSPMALPGTHGGMYTADGLEHNERGTPSSRASDHAQQLEKRQRKLAQHDYGAFWGEVEGDGEIAVVTWGSCTGAAREGLNRARDQGVAARLIALRLLSPFPTAALTQALNGVERLLVVEQTYSGQFHRYLRSQLDLPGETRLFARPGPLPIAPGEIAERLLDWSR